MFKAIKTPGSWPRIILFSAIAGAMVGGAIPAFMYQNQAGKAGPFLILIGLLLSLGAVLTVAMGVIPNVAEKLKPGRIERLQRFLAESQ